LICGKAHVTAVTDTARPAAQTACIGAVAGFEEIVMKANVGGIDRAARIAVGIVLLGLALTGTVGVWGWIGVVPLLTGLVGNCPLYSVLGMSTCPMKKT
jgi:hypothetical protein